MIKILEELEESYSDKIVIEDLMKKVRVSDIDGELSKIIRYLKETEKIIVVLQPETLIGSKTTRDKLSKWLQKIDEITITPDGIDFLTKLKRLETDRKRNYLALDTTIVLTQIAVIGIILTLSDKFGANLLNPAINVPWILSFILSIIFLTFSLLLFYKIINIIFSKESWKGILFSRD